MSYEMIGVIGVIILFALLFTRMWVGIAFVLTGLIGVCMLRGFPQAMALLGSTPFEEITKYSITVLPMFTLMGMIISESNIGSSLFKFGYNWLGRLPGGLASGTVAASGLLGAVSGSYLVGGVIMTKVAYPEMKRYNYDSGFSLATIAAGGPLSIILPPSMTMIMYGILTEQDIGKMFIAGVVPGLLTIIVFIVIISIWASLRPEIGPKGDKVSMKEKLRSVTGVTPILIVFLVVLGGIYNGIFTVTESGVIGVVAAMVIAFLNKSMSPKKLWVAAKEAILTSCMMLFLLMGSYIFATFMALSRLPFLLGNWIVESNMGYIGLIAILMLVYILLGIILPELSVLVLTVPILYPAMMAAGMDPIWFGIFITLQIALGSITPPIGLAVFIMSGMTKVPIFRIFKACTPYIIGDVAIIILISIFPELVTYLPGRM